MAKPIDLAGFGVRLEDWEQALDEIVSPAIKRRVMQHAKKLSCDRNRIQNAHGDVSGRCATHGDTFHG